MNEPQQQSHFSNDEQTKKDDPIQLMAWLDDFTLRHSLATSQKKRCEEVMCRASMKKWKPEKVAREVRRLTKLNNEIEQSENAIDQLTHRLSQLGIEV